MEEHFVRAAQRLAGEFGSVTAAAVERLRREGAPGCRPEQQRGGAGERHPGALDGAPLGREQLEELPSLYRPGHMRRRLEQLLETNRRYGHPFGLAVFDASGPGTRPGDVAGGQETVLSIVGAALRDSIRIVDEAFRLEEDAICVLAPNIGTVEGVQMCERLLGQLDELERAGGLRICDLGRRRRLPRPRRRRRRASAQGRRGDVAGAGRGAAGGRRRLARSLTVSAKSVR